MSLPKIVVHTDIVLEFLLLGSRKQSTLRLAMQKFFCYTTVVNVIELFSIARTGRERKALEHAMSAMKILGLNARNAKRYGELLARRLPLPRMNALIAGVCLESKLPVLTGRPREFRGVKGLVIVPGSLVTDDASAAEIIRRCPPPPGRN